MLMRDTTGGVAVCIEEAKAMGLKVLSPLRALQFCLLYDRSPVR